MRINAPFEKMAQRLPLDRRQLAAGLYPPVRGARAAHAAPVQSERGGSTVIITVGDEILSGFTLDTNSHLLARLAFAAGWPVRRIEVVADDVAAIAAAIGRAIAE